MECPGNALLLYSEKYREYGKHNESGQRHQSQ